MIEKKIEAGKRVAKELFPTEHAIDAALVGAARLIIATVEGRKDARLTPSGVHTALVAAAEGMSTLVEAHGAIASAHDEIVRIRDEERLPTTGYGCEYGCSPQASARQRPDLSVVS